MNRVRLLHTILILYAAALVVAIFSWIPKPTSWFKAGDTFGRVVEVRIYGPIRIDMKSSDWGAPDADQITRRLYQLAKQKDVKAIVLRINSPGGTVAATQEIYAAVKHCREKGKKVVASLGDVAASGGYYVATAADRIVADPGTITGSIGVIFQFGNLQELFRKVGVRLEVIKSGEHKDIGSPARELTPEERRMLQTTINDAYQQFFDAVTEGRNAKPEKIRPLADGRLFTGRQALAVGLVDELGGRRDAHLLAKKLAGLPEDAPVSADTKRSIMEMMKGLSSRAGASWFESVALDNGPSVEYRWR